MAVKIGFSTHEDVLRDGSAGSGVLDLVNRLPVGELLARAGYTSRVLLSMVDGLAVPVALDVLVKLGDDLA